MPAIHQFIAGYTHGDAISNEANLLRDTFRSWGYQSELFSELRRVPAELRKQARDVADYKAVCNPDDVVLLHLSIGSIVNDVFAELPCKKAIRYHNITPEHYFISVQKQIASLLRRGRKQLKELSATATVNTAVSRFNASELAELGYADPKVVPFMVNFESLTARPNRAITREFNDGKTNILFVGRCAPNKKIEDLIMAFSVFQKTVDPNSRFIHVGSFSGLERYHHLLVSMARDLKLRDVHFAGAVPQTDLIAFYNCASLFLCMSEHEGFCIPLFESMLNEVPVMAYAAAAIPETMDGAGVLFNQKKYDMIAEMMGRLTHDLPLRSAVLGGQADRLNRYRSCDLGAELKQVLSPLLTP